MEIQDQTSKRSFPIKQITINNGKKKTVAEICVGSTPKTDNHRTSQRGMGFYSPSFLVKKKMGDLRPALDLKNLNKKIQVKAFKMESLQMILLAINLGDWMLSIDL